MAKHIADLGKNFLKNMGEGFYRGMVLRIYKAKIKDIVGTTKFAYYLKGQKLTKDNRLIVYVREPWKTELHMQRFQILQAINERLEKDFLNAIIFR